MANEIISLANLTRFKSKYDTYVAQQIASALAGVYKVKGSASVSQLNQMTASNLRTGDVYNLTDSGTLNAGSVSVVAGDNVVWVDEPNNAHWDKLAGIIDLSGYLPLSAGSSKPLTGTLYLTKIASSSNASIGSIYLDPTGLGGTGHVYIDDLVIGSPTQLTHNVNFIKPTLSSAVNITLPSSTGTLALTSDINSANIVNALGYTPYSSSNPSGYITGITSTMVVHALGYTPYNSTNPNGYISGITSAMVTSALGYTPLSTSDFATDSDIDALFS